MENETLKIIVEHKYDFTDMDNVSERVETMLLEAFRKGDIVGIDTETLEVIQKSDELEIYFRGPSYPYTFSIGWSDYQHAFEVKACSVWALFGGERGTWYSHTYNLDEFMSRYQFQLIRTEHEFCRMIANAISYGELLHQVLIDLGTDIR